MKVIGEDWVHCDQHSFHLGSSEVFPAEASIDNLQLEPQLLVSTEWGIRDSCRGEPCMEDGWYHGVCFLSLPNISRGEL